MIEGSKMMRPPSRIHHANRRNPLTDPAKSKSDSPACRVGNIDYDVAIKHAKEILIAEKNGEPAGLLLLNDFHKGAMIEIVYTSDKHRHAGIATDLYTHAIQHTNAKHIVVPYAVVEKNIDYWKQLGFCSFGVHGNDHYVDVDLVRLSTLPQKPFTPEQHKLTLAEIKIQQEILKRGFCVAEYV